MKFAALAIVAIWIAGLAPAASAVPAPPDCARRVNDTPAKAAECIARDSLWRHLSHIQTIADNNPDRGGHPNRNTGMPGYEASVDYVASLMQRAGYQVSIQSYVWRHSTVVGIPTFGAAGLNYRLGTDWSVAPLSGSGRVTALVQPVGNGCEKRDFSSFVRGHIALLARDFCPMDTQVTNATARGASAIVFYDSGTSAGKPVPPRREAVEYQMKGPARVPVLLLHSNAVGAGRWTSGAATGATTKARCRDGTAAASIIRNAGATTSPTTIRSCWNSSPKRLPTSRSNSPTTSRWGIET